MAPKILDLLTFWNIPESPDIPLVVLRYVGTESEQGRNNTNSRDIQGNIIFTFPSYIEETFQTMRVG